MPDRTDEELLTAYYAGDDQAFEELWPRLWEAAVKMARGMIRPGPGIQPEALAADAANEACLAVKGTREKPDTRWVEGRSSLRTWLAAIVFHSVANCLRRERRAHKTNAELGEVTAPPPADDEMLLALRKCLERLPPKHRELIERKYDQGQSQRDIARALGCSDATMSRAQARALELLRTLLRREVFGPDA